MDVHSSITMIGRAIYSNAKEIFLGDAAWTMPTIKICRPFPDVSAGAIVSRFFSITHQR